LLEELFSPYVFGGGRRGEKKGEEGRRREKRGRRKREGKEKDKRKEGKREEEKGGSRRHIPVEGDFLN
jgi:hypothetical protein